MKIRNLKYLIILLIVVELFNSCRKIPFDHRNKYCGTWRLNYTIFSYACCGHVTQSIREIYGKIYYHKSNKDKNSLIISFVNELTYHLEKDGTFTYTGDLPFCSSGKFSDKNTISFFIYTHACGGAQLNTTEYKFITGVKQ